VSAVIGRRAEAPQDEPEVPVIPDWLVDELHGNVAFVRDAIEAKPGTPSPEASSSTAD
jgi:hypothetical protein